VNHPGARRVRRRRSHRRRRIRPLGKAAVITGILAVLLTAGWLAFNRTNNSSDNLPATWSPNPSQSLAVLAGPVNRTVPIRKKARPTYNYSVVPGGVRTPAELREAVLRDPEVAQHYEGFRFERARVVELERPALVYLSYRKNGHIFWTRKRHPLKSGEKLITDGSISGRTRCANRISVRKQLAVSPEPDPSAVELDQFEPTAPLPPVLFSYPAQYQTALLGLPGGPGGAPAGPAGPPIYGSSPFPFFPPPLPVGGAAGGGGKECETPQQEKHEKDLGIVDDESKEKHCPPKPKPPKPPKPPATVPEPGTMQLMLIGVAGLGFAYWKKQRALS
jgi:PEP-CTERM motif